MTDIAKQNQSIEANVLIYAQAYLDGFHKAINNYYSSEITEVIDLGFPIAHLALFGKTLKDVSLKVFVSEYDFFLFFIKPNGQKIEIFNYIDNDKYNRDWTFNTPSDIKLQQVKKEINLENVLEEINVPGINRYPLDVGRLGSDGMSHGNGRGITCGKLARHLLPAFKQQDAHTKQLISFSQEYKKLIALFEKKNKTKEESLSIGHRFETLWREVLNYWGWQARKIEIDGERDDFTAMYKGNHILGECRWVNEEQDADEVRAFAGKLNPRARSIGLMIAYSGFNINAYAQARRSVQSGNTLVFFSKKQIDRIIINFVDPGEVMDSELRNVLDFLYEK